jgi:hypothetical protein
MVQEVLD